MLRLMIFACALLGTSAAYAGPDDFRPGPVVAIYGTVADVEGAAPIAQDTTFRVVFDVAEAAEASAVNRRLESAARFLNMHARAGVPRENIHLAIVVHGPASRDLTSVSNTDEPNANA
ncbi:MAG: hypothetical protein R3C30_16935 [Hyphomonadaceae bacterium]